ncbi:hypothetical protein D4R99_00735 [bacterium]|nr:MAG: hypothetical protein D4R99_00735 [bacterium]
MKRCFLGLIFGRRLRKTIQVPISLLIIVSSVVILLVIWLSVLVFSPKLVSTPTSVSQSSPTETQNSLAIEWEQIKKSSKYLQCAQSIKSFDQKKDELLPGYKEVLKKETKNLSAQLSIDDQYIKTVYGWVNARGWDYHNFFSEIIGGNVPNTEKEMTRIKSFLEYIYCPDISNLPVKHPLTAEGCSQLLLSWMAGDTGVPSSDSYKVIEEYNLAMEKFKAYLQNHTETVRKCCNGEERGGSCTSLPAFVK